MSINYKNTLSYSLMMETDLILGIFSLVEEIDERIGQPYYIAVVRFAKRPDLKLGKCEVLQNGKTFSCE